MNEAYRQWIDAQHRLKVAEDDLARAQLTRAGGHDYRLCSERLQAAQREEESARKLLVHYETRQP